MKQKLLSTIVCCAVAVSQLGGFYTVTAQTETSNARQMEYLDRGAVCVCTDNGVLISWRLLGTEAFDTAFNVYRNGIKLNALPITNSTNFLDETGNAGCTYIVETLDMDYMPVSQTAEFMPFSTGTNYIAIPLSIPAGGTMIQNEIVDNKDTGNDYEQSYTYTANDISTGDLDGDGQYELVIKWEPTNAAESLPPTYTANSYLDAYKLDGTRLWDNPINLGMNIRSGAHYTQFLVYDFNGDGKAELSCKTGQCTTDAQGNVLIENTAATPNYNYIPEASLSYTDLNDRMNSPYSHVGTNGQVLSGHEYYSVFDGQTGTFIDTTDYFVQRGVTGDTPSSDELESLWGDGFGNRSERYLSTVAYLDGKTPNMITWRGYYRGRNKGGRTAVGAYRLNSKNKLELVYTFDTCATLGINYADNTAANNPYFQYSGQGNHNMVSADVDDDGKDEIMSGSLCLQVDDTDTLVPKWNYGLGHGDAFHIGRYEKGEHLRYFVVHEDSPCGMSIIDPYADKDGGKPDVLYHTDGDGDTARGIMANIGYGDSSYVAGGYGQVQSVNGQITPLTETISIPYNFRIFWDGDFYEELLDEINIVKWNDAGNGINSLFSADGCSSNNSTKATPGLQADLFGDWREEVVYRTEDNTALRIYTTPYQTDKRLYTLMHDSMYRTGVAAEQTAYNQPPHISYYVGEDMDTPSPLPITYPAVPSETAPPIRNQIPVLPSDDITAYSISNFVTAYDAPAGADSISVTSDNGITSIQSIITRPSDETGNIYGGSAGFTTANTITGDLTVSMDVKFKSGNATIQLRDNNKNLVNISRYTNMLGILSAQDGRITLTAKNGSNKVATNTVYSGYDPNTWYTLTFRLRQETASDPYKIGVSVSDAATGQLLGISSLMRSRQDALNFKRVAFYGNSAHLEAGQSATADIDVKNIQIYSGSETPTYLELSTDAALDTDDYGGYTAKVPAAQTALQFTAQHKTVSDSSAVPSEQTIWSITKNDLSTPVVPEDGITVSDNGAVSVSPATKPASYVITAADRSGKTASKLLTLTPDPVEVTVYITGNGIVKNGENILANEQKLSVQKGSVLNLSLLPDTNYVASSEDSDIIITDNKISLIVTDARTIHLSFTPYMLTDENIVLTVNHNTNVTLPDTLENAATDTTVSKEETGITKDTVLLQTSFKILNSASKQFRSYQITLENGSYKKELIPLKPQKNISENDTYFIAQMYGDQITLGETYTVTVTIMYDDNATITKSMQYTIEDAPLVFNEYYYKANHNLKISVFIAE